MKKKMITLFLATMAGSVLLFAGCGSDETATSGSVISTEAETVVEATVLTDGELLVHFVWYTADQERLANATVTLSNGNEVLFVGTTDAKGCLDTCTLPSNTTISVEITDSTGTSVASAEFIFQVSEDYSTLTIYTADADDNSTRVVELPTDKNDIRAAVFLTEAGQISFANITPYDEALVDEEEDEEIEAEDEETTEEDAAEDAEDDAVEDDADTANEE